jgi:hypothetical protein
METVTNDDASAVRGGTGDNNPPHGSLPGANAEPTIVQVKIRVLPDGRVTRKDAARYLGVAVKTVAMWDLEDPSKLGGVKVGGRRFYYLGRLDAFIQGKAA